MNLDKMTQKTQEMIRSAQSLAEDNHNQNIEQAHILYSLITQENGLISELFKKMGVSLPNLEAETKHIVDGYPKVSGSGFSGNQIYISRETEDAFNAAEEEAKKMNDSYLSVEHVMLGILDKPDRLMGDLFKNFNII